MRFFLSIFHSSLSTQHVTTISTMAQHHDLNAGCWPCAAKDAGKYQAFFWEHGGQRRRGWGGWRGEGEKRKTKWPDRSGRQRTSEPRWTQNGWVQASGRRHRLAARREATEGGQFCPKRNSSFAQSADSVSSDDQSADVSCSLDQSAGPETYDGAEYDRGCALRRFAPRRDCVSHWHTWYQTNGLYISLDMHLDWDTEIKNTNTKHTKIHCFVCVFFWKFTFRI